MGFGFKHFLRDPHLRLRRWSVLVVLALLVVCSTSDTTLSNVAAYETAQADPDPNDAYCRVRRDLLVDWAPILSVTDESTVVLIAPPALVPRVALRSTLPPCPTMEHQSTLTRRTRAPGWLNFTAR
ncbi:MAG: hypothetical protein ABI353_23790 [Isosphaeraceae bacterium]